MAAILASCAGRDLAPTTNLAPAVADTFRVRFMTIVDTVEYGWVIATTRLDTVGTTPVVISDRSFFGGPLGNRVERSVDRFPDLAPLYSTVKDSSQDVVIQFTPTYMRVDGTGRFGTDNGFVPRTKDERSYLNVELWVRAAPLADGIDTTLVAYAGRGPGIPMVLSVERDTTVLTRSGLRRTWLVKANQGGTPVVTRWWLDTTTRRLLRQTISSPQGILEFTPGAPELPNQAHAPGEDVRRTPPAWRHYYHESW